MTEASDSSKGDSPNEASPEFADLPWFKKPANVHDLVAELEASLARAEPSPSVVEQALAARKRGEAIDLVAVLEASLRDAERHEMGRLADRLGAELRSAAKRTAIAAVLQSVDEDSSEVALRAGMALEYMAKAHLCDIHPALVAANDVESLALLTGNGHLLHPDKRHLGHAKTITASEACRRVVELSGGQWTFSKEDAAVLENRNAVIHLATLVPGGSERSISRMVALIDSLRELASHPEDRSRFWGDAYSAVEVMLRAEAEAHTAALEAKFAAARSRLRVQFARMDASASEAVARALEAAHSLNEWTELSTRCPVCHRWGWTEYELERLVESDDDDELSDEIGETAWAVGFDCPVCRLELGGDELKIVGVPSAFFVPFETSIEDTVQQIEPPRP